MSSLKDVKAGIEADGDVSAVDKVDSTPVTHFSILFYAYHLSVTNLAF